MNTFKQKSLYAALATLGALGATGAQAVSVNHDGLGQALIYPYYTVRAVAIPIGTTPPTSIDAAYNSLLSVVNSTASAKVEEVRCEAEVCYVKLLVTYDHARMKGITTPIVESWIVDGGQVWYVYGNK